MVYDYVITLKKPDYRLIDLVSQLMLLFSIVVLLYFFYLYPKTGVLYLVFATAILIPAIIIFLKSRRTGLAYYRLPLLIAAIAWFYTHANMWMGIVCALAAILEKQVKFSQEIGFSENEITFNSFPKRKLRWSEINNALIKDGLITIDQKNNKLFQKEIDSGVSLQVEKEFNEFCRQQLQKAVVG